ncbi:unnamed protein product [Camellia sinensis]
MPVPARSGFFRRRRDVEVEIKDFARQTTVRLVVIYDGGGVGVAVSPTGDGGVQIGHFSIESVHVEMVMQGLGPRKSVEEEERTRRRKNAREVTASASDVGQVEVERRRTKRHGGDRRIVDRGIHSAALARAAHGGGVVGGGDDFGRRGEVDFGLGATELPSCRVVRPRRLLSCVEGTKPDAAPLCRISDLGGITTPWSLPHTSVTSLLALALAVAVSAAPAAAASVDGVTSIFWSHIWAV